jgi:serine/threonine protein kinase
VHRDLKPENVMLEREGDISDVKIIDFGTALRWDSRILPDENKEEKLLISGRKGTPNYMAPEVFRAKSGDEHAHKFNELSDMWSIGIIAYILCTNKDPFLLLLDRSSEKKDMNEAIKHFER